MEKSGKTIARIAKGKQLPLTPATAKLLDAAERPKSEVLVSKRATRKAEAIEMVRTARDDGKQDIGFSSRPFILCGLPLKRPPKNVLLHTRRNGNLMLEVTGHPRYGLPFGQDRLIPIWVATVALRTKSREIRFKSAAEILDCFDLPKDGRTYRRLIDGFKRVFAATIFFGTREEIESMAGDDLGRTHYFDRLRVWYTRKLDQNTLPSEDFENLIVLSEPFWRELQQHPIPVDLNVVRGLADSPGACDFYLWAAWRCWKAKRSESIPLFGPAGLIEQLGVSGYSQKWKFRQTLRRWIAATKAHWPDCPVRLAEDGNSMLVSHGRSIAAR